MYRISFSIILASKKRKKEVITGSNSSFWGGRNRSSLLLFSRRRRPAVQAVAAREARSGALRLRRLGLAASRGVRQEGPREGVAASVGIRTSNRLRQAAETLRQNSKKHKFIM